MYQFSAHDISQYIVVVNGVPFYGVDASDAKRIALDVQTALREKAKAEKRAMMITTPAELARKLAAEAEKLAIDKKA